MAGTFLIGQKMTRPGVYYRRERRGYTVEGATNGILAVLFNSNWGPLNKVVDIDQTDLNNLDKIFGEGDGIDAIREGLLGGATTVRAIRVGTAPTGGVLTGINLGLATQPESDTPLDVSDMFFSTAGNNPQTGVATAVKIRAKYYGNKVFKATVRDDLVPGKRQFIIYANDEIFQAFDFTKGGDEAQSLVDAMANDRNFEAKKIVGGVLANADKVSFSTGIWSPSPQVSDYEKGTNILERYRWNCVVSDTDNTSVRQILNEFVKQSYETGHLGMTCFAGLSTETLARPAETLEARMDYAASCNDEKIVYLLSGWVGNDGTVYDGWRAAARIGGMIAGCESNVSLTHDVISNALKLIEPLSNGEIIRAEQKGCLVLSLNADNQVQIDNAINTLITEGALMDAGWKKIRRTKTRFELMDRINRTHDRLVGFVNNDANGRGTVIAAAQRIINEMIAENKLVFGSYVEEDPGHPPEGDSAWFLLHILDLDSLEKIYLTYIFRYNQTFDEE